MTIFQAPMRDATPGARVSPLAQRLMAVGLALLLAGQGDSAQAWQTLPELPAESAQSTLQYSEQEPSPRFAPVVEPEGPLAHDPAYDPAWTGYDHGGNVLTDTSLIAWWNRAFVEEGAAGVPPYRTWWTPSAFTGQLLWLNRNGAEQSVVLTGGVVDPITLAVNHSAAVMMSDLVLPVEAGFRGSVMFGKLGNWQPELAYLGVFDQNASVNYAPAATTGVVETGAPFFDLNVITSVTDMTVSYESDLHSVEYNLWLDDGWRIQALAGIRWIQQSEEFEQLQSIDWSDRTFAQFTNDLVGGQIGFRTFLMERGKLSMFAICKGGVYRNQVDLRADVESAGTVLSSLAQSGSTTSCAGELNLTAVWQFTPYFNFHCGYTGLWLTNVGLVGDQFNDFTFASGSGAFDYDAISYQGGHLGVTIAW